MAHSVLITGSSCIPGGGMLIATLFHGAINLSRGFFLGGTDPARRYRLLVAVYGPAAIVVSLILRRHSSEAFVVPGGHRTSLDDLSIREEYGESYPFVRSAEPLA